MYAIEPSKKSPKYHFDCWFMNEPLDCGTLLLAQLGDLYTSPGFEIKTHVQVFHEISFIESGRAIFTVNDKEYHVSKDTVILSPLHSEHRIVSDQADPVRYFYAAFSFNSPKFREVEEVFNTTENYIIENCFGIYEIFYNLFSEMKEDHLFKEQMIESFLTQILIKIIRYMRKNSGFRYSPLIRKQSDESLVHDIINLIQTRSYTINTLNSIGKELGYSYPYISKIFSNKMGITIMDYYKKQLFKRAAEMLESNVKITVISDRLGYKSVHSFSRAFSNYYGVSPTKYKAINRD